MRDKKRICALFLGAVLAAVLAFSAIAAETEEISELTLSITSDITIGSTDSVSGLEIIVDTEGCYLDEEELRFTNEPSDGWDEGDKPRLRLVIRADEGYRFAKELVKSDVYLQEDEGTVTAVSRQASQVTVNITLPGVDDYDYDREDNGDYDLEVHDLAWDEAEAGTAFWSGSDYARSYEVKLVLESGEVTEILTTEQNRFDFSGYLAESGNYSFQVRAVRTDSNKGYWKESDERYLEKSGDRKLLGGARKPADGAWLHNGSGWWWCRSDRTWPASQWEYINGEWYYFDEAGYCLTGQWVKDEGRWYYCNESGAMLKNARTPDGFYVGGDGVWIP